MCEKIQAVLLKFFIGRFTDDNFSEFHAVFRKIRQSGVLMSLCRVSAPPPPPKQTLDSLLFCQVLSDLILQVRVIDSHFNAYCIFNQGTKRSRGESGANLLHEE